MIGINQAKATCTEPDTYWYADQHFKLPRPTSQTQPVHWCPRCLGSGIEPGDVDPLDAISTEADDLNERDGFSD